MSESLLQVIRNKVKEVVVKRIYLFMCARTENRAPLVFWMTILRGRTLIPWDFFVELEPSLVRFGKTSNL